MPDPRVGSLDNPAHYGTIHATRSVHAVPSSLRKCKLATATSRLDVASAASAPASLKPHKEAAVTTGPRLLPIFIHAHVRSDGRTRCVPCVREPTLSTTAPLVDKALQKKEPKKNAVKEKTKKAKKKPPPELMQWLKRH